MYDFLIVGAGLFGAVFAYEASQRGKRCLVIDRRGHIGGNVFCEEVAGITIHRYGAHVFHTDDGAIWDYINRFADFNRFVNSPIADYNGELYNLPFNMNTFYKMWGVKTPDEALAIIERQRTSAAKPTSLEGLAVSLVGTDIYEKLIKGYSEKQWGRKCSDLPASIIKRLPVRFTFDNNYYNDRFQGVPIGGYNQIIEKMLERCDVKLGADYFSDESRYRYIADRVVYTGRIDEFFGYCHGALEYRSLSFESEVLDTPNFQGSAAVYYTSADIPFTRIIEHKHLENGVQGRTVITREYPMEWVTSHEPLYPINDARNSALYSKYLALARQERNVAFGGRLGTYRYLDMWQVISEALECSQSLL